MENFFATMAMILALSSTANANDYMIEGDEDDGQNYMCTRANRDYNYWRNRFDNCVKEEPNAATWRTYLKNFDECVRSNQEDVCQLAYRCSEEAIYTDYAFKEIGKIPNCYPHTEE